MKYWGTLLVAGALVLSASGAFAEPQTAALNVAMPLPVPEEGQPLLAGNRHAIPGPSQKFMNQLNEEKAKLSVDMDQTCEKLEAKIFELKKASLTTKGVKNHFMLNRKISKLEGQRAAIAKMQNKVAKTMDGSLNGTKRDWSKLKTNIDKQMSALQ
ncbi:MAG TPA: hypothetical protein V6C99_01740 [Oculatellaceae cyanobacterium]